MGLYAYEALAGGVPVVLSVWRAAPGAPARPIRAPSQNTPSLAVMLTLPASEATVLRSTVPPG